jgi:hypothetical protein
VLRYALKFGRLLLGNLCACHVSIRGEDYLVLFKYDACMTYDYGINLLLIAYLLGITYYLHSFTRLQKISYYKKGSR